MKRLHKRVLFLSLLILAVMLSGCGKKEKTEYKAYQIDAEGKSLSEKKFEFKSQDTSEMIEEVIFYLNEDRLSETNEETVSADKESEIPLLTKEVEIESWEMKNNLLKLTFSESYSQMDQVREVLCRDGIVQMLLQIPDVSAVEFYVGGKELTDASGDAIGLMDLETFVSNPTSEINSVQSTNLTLYFGSEDGKSLVAEKQEVRYLNSRSLERMVVEQLISGPETEGHKATLPSETELVNVATSNGVCYVNLSGDFTKYATEVSGEVTIYSIVNSLCQLDEVKMVQISVDGETNLSYDNSISLDQKFKMNRSLIVEE